MPFKIVRNDLTRMTVDMIVNTASSMPVIGSGTDAAVYAAAGAERLIKARCRIGDILVGEVRVTSGFDLPARYVAHAVSPNWKSPFTEESAKETLQRSCYRNALELARKKRCKSIAFPILGSGNNACPKELALKIALSEIQNFLMDHEMMVYLVVYDGSSVKLSESLFDKIEKYIDETYIEEKRDDLSDFLKKENAARSDQAYYGNLRFREVEERMERAEDIQAEAMLCDESTYFPEETQIGTPESDNKKPELIGYYAEKSKLSMPRMAAPGSVSPAKMQGKKKTSRSLEDLVNRKEETFQQMLLRLIKERGLTNAQAYKKANQDKQLFSKIRHNEQYQPSKKTAMAFAIALELNLDEAKDLLARAGYAFSPSSNFDKIIQYFIENESYNIFAIETALYDHGQDTLCNY